jgi:prefoldin subunit 5
VLKKDFEIAISSIQNRIEDLSKNKFENENLISELKD